MAITGDGKTPDTAYLVHDYWELKAACTYGTYKGYDNDHVRYVKLANDIDCNSDAYENDFEWNSITLGRYLGYTDGFTIDLNLNNKTIKNVMIASDNSLFIGYGSDTNMTTIHDGKILNIFCNNASHIIQRGNNEYSLIFKNVSISVNGTSLTSTAFDFCYFKESSLYYKSSKLNNNIFYPDTAKTMYINSDFYFDIENCNSKFVYSNTSNTNNVWDSCRIGGKFGGYFPISRDSNYIKKANNIVFDAEIKTGSYSATSYSVCTNSTGICNITKANLGSCVVSGLTNVTSTEIKSATELTKKGFVVTNISPSTTT